MKKMAKKSLAIALTGAMCLALVGCGGGSKETKAETKGAETSAADETKAAEEGAVDLNALTLDEITEKAKAEGEVVSVGMPDEWADWGSLWQAMSDTYGISHNDTDMSSSEELQMFATEGKNGTKDIGDVGYGFAGQAVSEDLVQGYKITFLTGLKAKTANGWLHIQALQHSL